MEKQVDWLSLIVLLGLAITLCVVLRSVLDKSVMQQLAATANRSGGKT
jgi:hypothetical protein